jgi:hypothetical protein
VGLLCVVGWCFCLFVCFFRSLEPFVCLSDGARGFL